MKPDNVDTPLVVVDAQYLGRKAQHTTGSLFYKGKPTGVIFGFLQQLLQISQALQSTRFVFCWDSPKSKRKEMFPAYKRKRHTKPLTDEQQKEEAYVRLQFKALRRDILPRIGFRNVWRFSGYEADDLMAHIAHAVLTPVVLVTADEDMYQVLSPTVSMWRRGSLYTVQDFVKEYSLQPHDWKHVRAIGGCPTDEVPSAIPKTRERTVVSALNKWGTANKPNSREQAVLDLYAALVHGTGISHKSERFQQVLDARRNYDLTSLPFNRHHFKREIDPTGFVLSDWKAFKQVCREHGLRSFIEGPMRRMWKDFYTDRPPPPMKRSSGLGIDTGAERSRLIRQRIRL